MACIGLADGERVMERVEMYVTTAMIVSRLNRWDAVYKWLHKALVTCQQLPDNAETMAARGKILCAMERIRQW